MPEIPQATADKAAAIQAAFNAKVTSIRSDGDLTVEARTRRLAQAWADANTKMTALQESWSGTSQQTADNLTRQAFGDARLSGADAISVRDADDRASRIDDPAEAMSLLERAENNGDGVLARALASHAFNNSRNQPFGAGGWSDVVDAYTATRPTVARQIAEIAAAQRNDIASIASAMFVFSLAKPTELERFSDYRIKLVADGNVA